MTTIDFDPFAGGELLRVSPTTWPQKEIIASAQMSDEANTAFNEAISIDIEGELNIGLLELCFNKLLERHDILRATFSRKGNEICLHEAKPFKLGFEDLRDLDPESQNREIRNVWRNIAISPMNLEEGPLFFAWIKQLTDSSFELIIAAHHVICDGWSIGLLLKELTQLYRNHGKADALPPAQSFFEFAEQSDAEEIANIDIDYWREKFKQPPPVLELPLDKTRPMARTFQARRFDFELDKSLVALMPKAAAKMKASLVNVVMAGYFALLYRLTSTSDIVVGLPVAGQAALGRINQLGHMVQLLPIRVAVDGDCKFSDLVNQVKCVVLDASEHPRFTFGKLLEKMVVDRSRVPLISTIFNVDQPMNELDFGAAKGSLRTVPRAAENFEMFLNVLPTANQLTIEATYSTVLFSETTVVSWLKSLENILTEAVTDPQISVSDIALAKEVPDVLLQTNATSMEVRNHDFIRAFRNQVEKFPNAEAVFCNNTVLTYGQLDRLSDYFAKQMAAKGIKDGDVVGLRCQRSEKMVVGIMALFKIGAAYLPLDPEFPPDRLRYMLEDAGAVAIIEDNTGNKEVCEKDIIFFNVEDLPSADTVAVGTVELPEENPNRLAYIIYTSGSTGQPKGVRVQHGAVINLIESMAQEPGCSVHDRLLAVVTLSFDMSIPELYLPLICGASIVVADREQVKDGDKLADLIEKHNITILQATPSTWRMLLSSKWKDLHHGVRKLKAWCGGEPMSQDLRAQLLPRVSELWNMYGPTEITVYATFKRIRHSDSTITIGKPIANTQVYILDRKLKLLPISTPGELYIGGAGVTLGYHNRPELNNERFIKHPQFGRIYKTGDLAKILPNGEVQHMGRLDDQVKLRGYRIELGEIEAALVGHMQVKAAAAYLWELSPEDVRIVACCVPSEGALQSAAIRKQLREKLPSYMVPQYLLELDQIPLMPNGKINRRGLPKPELGISSILSASPLTSETENKVAKIWADLIKPKKPIAREDNFFEVGGHSLLALDAIRQIEKATGIRLKVTDMVTERLAAIAEKVAVPLIDKSGNTAGPSALSSRAERGLSPEQARILKRQLEYPQSICNNLPAAWLLEGDLDLKVFSKSLERVYERQTALRTVIEAHGGDYRQILIHVHEIRLPEFTDCTTATEPFNAALSEAYQMAAQPFMPLGNLLVRAKLFKIDNHRHLFVFVPHQLIFDGWSFDVFLSELESAYTTFSENRAPSTNPLPFEFRDYAQWHSARNIQREHLDYHIHTIEEMTKVAPSEKAKGNCARRHYNLPRNIYEKIERFCEIHKLRLHEFLFAGFASVLMKHNGVNKIHLGMPVTGRYTPDVIGLIGSFVSILPCLVTIESSNFIEVAKDIAQQLREFHEHQDISYAEIVRGTDIEKAYFPSYIYASFGFQDIRNRPTSLAGLELTQIDMPRKQTELPIEYWVRIQPNDFMVVFDYDIQLVEDATIDHLGQKIQDLLNNVEKLAAGPNQLSEDSRNISKKPLWRRLFQ